MKDIFVSPFIEEARQGFVPMSGRPYYVRTRDNPDEQIPAVYGRGRFVEDEQGWEYSMGDVLEVLTPEEYESRKPTED